MFLCDSRSSGASHKAASSIPLPGSALPARKCPPDKVRPMAGSSRATSPALSMIPRAPPTASPYHPPPQSNKTNSSMLDKLKLFKNNNERPVSATTTTTTTGKRTSSSSGVSSAKSERSDSSVSLDVKPMVSRSSGVRATKQQKVITGGNGGKVGGQVKGSPNSGKREVLVNGGGGSSAKASLEKHAHKLANLPTPPVAKIADVKVKVSSMGNIRQVSGRNIRVLMCKKK